MSGTLRLSLAFALTTLGSSATAAPAPATGSNVPLPYPAKAPLVVHVNGFERVQERLTKMLDALPPAESKLVKKELEAGLAQ